MVKIRFAQVPERVSTKSFVVLIIGNSKSFHLGAQDTFKDVHIAQRRRGCSWSRVRVNEIIIHLRPGGRTGTLTL